MNKIKVAILGATGMVGQRFVEMLESHPYFEIEGLYASEKSSGKTFADVLKIRDYTYNNETLRMKIETIDPSKISKSCRVVFSGLPSDIAGPIETELAKEGVGIFTNAGSHRMDENVAILIPEVNSEHLDSIKSQDMYQNGGFIVTNANCATTGVAVPLVAIKNAYGLEDVFISTYQAISGAGYPGIPSLDIAGNVVPFIRNEEEKLETELTKIFGKYKNKKFETANFNVYANCARVPVVDGHLESLIIKTNSEPSVDEIINVLNDYIGEPQKLNLPSAPRQPIIVRKETNRPQPVLDVFAGGTGRSKGMAITVGRVRKKDEYYKLFVLSHNTLRGGAGGSVLNAELAVAMKYI